ncbi:MAG: PP2C family protein-serine/threonine phosphatase [Oscillospiraceae bacterium]|nr:PP2C family protein-serine/threonine phosphatase [Oscillospiraceae bacterium]
MQDKRRSGKIAMQINRPMIIFEVIFIIFTALVLFFYNMGHYITSRYDSAMRLARSVAFELESYDSLHFLVPYWQGHYEEMAFFYGDKEQAEAKGGQLSAMLPDPADIRTVTSEQAEALDPEGQKLFAEVCYYELSEYYSRMKSANDPEFLTGFVVRDDETFFLLTGVKADEARISSGGDVFELGTVAPYIEGVYPMLDEIILTGQPSSSMELSLKKGADRNYVHTFEPVYEDGDLVMYVGVSIQWKDLIVSVLQMSLFLAVITAILFLMLGMLMQHLMKRTVIIPLKNEQQIINDYKESKDAERTIRQLACITPDNEIQDLAEDFSSMVEEICRHIKRVRSITAEKERIGAELELARKIQADMLPNIFPAFPERNDFDIYASMTPAKEVGGDFYDFFLIDEDHLGLVMADVSGKGVPAALFMMMAKILVNNYAMMGGSPARVLEQVNTQICMNNKEEMFVTVWFGVLEISTGKVKAASAGHEYPILRSADGSFQLFRDIHGFVIGGMEGMRYKEYDFLLEKGGTLFLYTDGVAEATNAQNELFGTERMLQALNTDPQADPKTLLANMTKAVDTFVGDAPQFDDLTMLCVKRL